MDLREQLESAVGVDFDLGVELGGGGMSRVYRATERKLGRDVVIKVLAPELAAGISAERFRREIQLAASLQQANIVPLLTTGEAAGLPWFTMPYVDGKSLRARLSAGPRLTVAECVGILRDVARALGYAHERGIVHRDIKPDNILLSRGTAVVTDFGIAKAIADSRMPEVDEALTHVGTSLGTPAYMSPEQAAGDPSVDQRADLYALGIVAYEMLAGRVPYTGTPQAVMAAHVSVAPAPLSATEEIPPSLTRIVMRCLEKDPLRRYQSADALLVDLDGVITPSSALPSAVRRRPYRGIVVAGVTLALTAVAWVASSGFRQRRWAKDVAIPKIVEFSNLGQNDSAWMLAREVEKAGPLDSATRALWLRFSRKAVLNSEPSGAQVWRAAFGDTSHWVLLGTTPLDSIYLPLGVGHVRVERAGYRTFSGLMNQFDRTFPLDSVAAASSDMQRIKGGRTGIALAGAVSIPPLDLSDYAIGRHEVTNREYRAFVDAGGYSRREWWPEVLGDDGQPLSWEAAQALFVDKTGRPGPSTWEAGSYAPGQAGLPVGGVSWYEASAYARFVGKSLPTIFHWSRAAGIGSARFILPGSNFEGAPRIGSTWAGVSPFGAFDMAGNVREWCENSAGGGERYILGGGSTDLPYSFTYAYAQRAMDRSAINGIRLAQYANSDTVLTAARRELPRILRDYATERPTADGEFPSFLAQFEYDRTPLNARVDQRDTSDAEWNIERVSFDAAYGGERMMAVLLLPKNVRGRLQAVVYFPGANVISLSNSVERRDQLASFVVKSGRAYVLPILKSTYERRDSLPNDVPNTSIFWRDHVVMWVKDMRRTLDYLAERTDMDSTRFAYFGVSWGGRLAPVPLVAEPRFKTAVLTVAGLRMERSRPEVEPFNYLPRVKVPTLMLNGRYDYFFPVETSQKPFFENLGTPKNDKAWKVYDGGHDVPRTELIAETLKWLDRYLGPVR